MIVLYYRVWVLKIYFATWNIRALWRFFPFAFKVFVIKVFLSEIFEASATDTY